MLWCGVMSDTYTLALSEIAEHLQRAGKDIAESTVRKYAKNYRDYLPSQKPEGERWAKYPEDAVTIIGRIFDLSQAGKARHEIKSILDQEGFRKTIDADADDATDTVTESTHPYTHTPPAASQPHGDNTPNLPIPHTVLRLMQDKDRLLKSAVASIEFHRALAGEKEAQINDLEAQLARLKEEKQKIEEIYKAEMMNILENVTEWKSQGRAVPKRKTGSVLEDA